MDQQPKKYILVNGIKTAVYDFPPDGWVRNSGVTTDPKGDEWWWNKKSRFVGNEYKIALVKDRWNYE